MFPPGLAPLRYVGGVVYYAEVLVYCLLFVASTIYLWFEANAAAGSNWTPAIRRTGRGFLQDLLGALGARATRVVLLLTTTTISGNWFVNCKNTVSIRIQGSGGLGTPTEPSYT